MKTKLLVLVLAVVLCLNVNFAFADDNIEANIVWDISSKELVVSGVSPTPGDVEITSERIGGDGSGDLNFLIYTITDDEDNNLKLFVKEYNFRGKKWKASINAINYNDDGWEWFRTKDTNNKYEVNVRYKNNDISSITTTFKQGDTNIKTKYHASSDSTRIWENKKYQGYEDGRIIPEVHTASGDIEIAY
jgi:hypothetical protein